MNPEQSEFLRQASEYLTLREGGVQLPFPQQLAVTLLSSDHTDSWNGGLYLASQMPRDEIRQRFFETTTTYAALAVFLAVGIAAYRAARSLLPLQWSEHDSLSYLQERWGAPTRLVGLTMEEYYYLEQLLRAAQDGMAVARAPLGGDLGVLVHGTWGAKGSWWKPRVGTLWQHVRGYWPHLYDGGAPFAWSGANYHAARVKAAQQLISWTQARGARSVDIIAHSHGGNVCLLAARMGLPIGRLILLGTPIRTEYMVDLRKVTSIANVFALADPVQTPLGTFPHRRAEGRTLGDSPSVSNWRAEEDGAGFEPDHADLHEPSTWNASNLNHLLA